LPTFVIMGNHTSDAIEKMNEEGKRQQQAFELAKKYKCEVKALYYTMGKYDFVAIVEAPDNETQMKALFELAKGGAIRTRTLLAFPAEDIAKMTAEL
jgi:uncharacterized protein with GYD domain